MKPTFLGMNPYLEDPVWPEVHFGLISALARSLNPKLTPKYRAAVEKRVYSDALLVGIPDVIGVSARSRRFHCHLNHTAHRSATD